MESLAALGLASNIVQFVDFASKLVADTRTLYKSANPTSANSLVLREVAGDLTRLSDAVIVPNHLGDNGLKQLALIAKKVAGDILGMMDDLQVKGKKTAWKSFLIAVKEVRSEDTITSITNNITILQAQMTLRAQFQIKENIASLSNSIRNLQITNDRLHLNNTSELGKLRADLRSAFDTVNVSSQERRDTKCRDEGPTLDLKCLNIGDIKTISQSLPNYQSKISALSQDVDSITDAQDITESFYFDNLTTRELKIRRAHAKTFEWVFRDVLPDGSSRLGFKDWLRSGDGIFWIRGKAGSGKSTLMKFISHHPTTLDHLKCWSGPLQLVLGNFYFWNSGTDLQKSQEGLLQSLIFEILRQCPDLTPRVQEILLCQRSSLMPRSSKSDSCSSSVGIQTVLARIRNEGWTFCQLTKILKDLLGHDHSRKFCFFIDGLDEYKSQYTQDQQALIDDLCELVASPNIKICVSSRPFTVFLDAFDGGVDKSLKLEDLTKDDIRSFALDKLSGHSQFRKLTRIDPGYSTLVDEVVTKSQGVFLWVFLVVRELFDGLTFNDTIGIMRQRLESFPATLEEFFQHMLDSIDKVYRSQTIQLFQLSASAREPLPMLYYSALGDIEQNPGLSSEPQDLLDEPELSRRRDAMRRKLDACSKGLLEIVESRSRITKIDFLHRSVRDFVMSGAITALSEQPDHERWRTWLLFCISIILCSRRAFSDNVDYINLVGNRDDVSEELAYFVKKAHDDGADLATIHKTMLDAWGVAHVSGLDPTTTARFVQFTYAHGLTDYIESELLADDDSIRNAVAGTETLFSVEHYGPQVIRCFISCTEMRGPSSKVLLHPLFQKIEYLLATRSRKAMKQSQGAILDILKSIASTEYKLNQDIINNYFPEHYAELMHMNRRSRRKSKNTSTKIHFWFRRRIDVWVRLWSQISRQSQELALDYSDDSDNSDEDVRELDHDLPYGVQLVDSEYMSD
ncbi:hypothetical protein FHL15_007922 [Xylaria flabelliformis]|uniref:Uncharacterized protein n=1 Tax=Xylaria flabelliformis TaxID=2512241 RepID=A0A553HT68_9PEZI|nr:hypothetical protein FHL15_007922 [Xylaria flabelliformis]